MKYKYETQYDLFYQNKYKRYIIFVIFLFFLRFIFTLKMNKNDLPTIRDKCKFINSNRNIFVHVFTRQNHRQKIKIKYC